MKAVWLAGLCGMITLTASARQPAGPREGQPPRDAPREGGAQPEPTDRAGLRARAERRLAESKRLQERWEAAIKKIDAGAPLDEVEAEMRGPRPFQGGRGQDRPDANHGPRNGEPGPDHGTPPGTPTGKMSREEVLTFLAKDFPEISKRFADAMKENPGLTSRVLDRMEPRIRELLAERDPDMRALRNQNFSKDFELLNASKAFIDANRKNAGGDETKKAGETLRRILGEHFDLQIKIHQQEIVLLERRITQLREDLEKQLPKRSEFIEKRMDGLQRMPKERDQHGSGAAEVGGAPPKP